MKLMNCAVISLIFYGVVELLFFCIRVFFVRRLKRTAEPEQEWIELSEEEFKEQTGRHPDEMTWGQISF